MTLPSSGNINFTNVASEVGIGIGSVSLAWIHGNTKDGAYALNSIYGRAWYQNNNSGNCNNSNCATACSSVSNCYTQCTTIQCGNCTTSPINCANCDSRYWLQPNCNCACTYNCSQNTNNVPYNCNCDCACACACASGSCFLAGSLVYLATGDIVSIEDVEIGDKVVGAFGETNTVIALDRVKLGKRPMYCINDYHYSSNEHPHVSPDNKFYAPEPSALSKDWGRYSTCITPNGTEKLLNRGIGINNIKKLTKGITLKTIDGIEIVETIEICDYPFDTDLYNLVVDGSHTYIVDGYAVTGWPRNDDFDYEKWQQIKQLTLDDYR